MIMLSARDMDVGFVSKVISEHKLDPTPKTGFHADPLYWQETDRWKRVVERYDWGAAIFCSDRQRNAHATIVAVGSIDVEAGKVGRLGGMQDIQPGWYKEMAMELRDLKRSHASLHIPECLGFRRPDYICDGGKNTITQMMEPACAWRDRCMALQSFAQETDKQQEDLIRSKSPEQIIQLTTRLLERKGAIAKPLSGARPPSTSATPKPAASTSGTERQKAADPAATKVTLDLVSRITSEVAEAADVKLSADMTRQGAGPGELFLVDRTSASDYISLYLANRPRAIALASFRLRARVGMLVQLPILKDDELLKPIVADDVKVWSDGAFKTAVREVPLEGNRLEHIKHILVGIIGRHKQG